MSKMIEVFVEAWWSVVPKTVPGARPGTFGTWIVTEAELNQARARAGFAAILNDPEAMSEMMERAAVAHPEGLLVVAGCDCDLCIERREIWRAAIRAALTDGDTP